MDCSNRKTLLQLAVYSRTTIIILSFISNLIVPDHNATDVFIYRNENKLEDGNFIDKIIYLIFGGLIRWDANYFLHISHYGYTKENMLAFFPLFPFVVRSLSSLIYLFVAGFLLYSTVLLIVSILINFLLFVKCSLLLYDLSIKMFNHEKMAYCTAVIFCVNPASIFFTAPYSETLFSFLSFSAMLHSFNNNFVVSSMIAGLSCLARSNGILNVGFVLYTLVIFFITKFSLSLYYLFTATVLFILCITISLAPFCLFQLYAYVKFCLDDRVSFSSVSSLPSSSSSSSSWCNNTIPLAYSYVQKQYWNVGFLRYYQLKQIPNFLLALPIISIVLCNCYIRLKNEKVFLCNIYNGGLSVISEIKNNKYSTINKLNYLVFIIHAAALAVFCLLFVHVQISTRMLCSSSPVFYWFIADYFTKNCEKYNNKFNDRFSNNLINILNKKSYDGCDNIKEINIPYNVNVKYFWKFFFCNNNCTNDYSFEQFYIKLYLSIFFLLGTILFSNFYPWT